ncbi:hypothetical protein FOL47_010860 [Perkinsus chesapeaki]|uniref:Uncharacterized protein n=1 Tax=Perkinsus chesapeaki TaxID=330153 RepID=A0A7J6L015_PERCH|nr:hypothetical protein FOL47_010860 [Perkinsus chesapeaki]
MAFAAARRSSEDIDLARRAPFPLRHSQDCAAHESSGLSPPVPNQSSRTPACPLLFGENSGDWFESHLLGRLMEKFQQRVHPTFSSSAVCAWTSVIAAGKKAAQEAYVMASM